MRKVLFTVVLLMTFHSSRAQEMPEAVLESIRSSMSQLELLNGEWTGEGSMTFGPGQSQGATVLETGQFKLDGTVFVIEGVGRAMEAVDGEYPVVHHAYGVISYDMISNQYRMRAYRLGGQYIDADLAIDGNTIVWGFEDPRAGTIQYEIVIEPGVSWHETGKFSRDGGTTWFPFFEMNLSPATDARP